MRNIEPKNNKYCDFYNTVYIQWFRDLERMVYIKTNKTKQKPGYQEENK